MNSKLQSLVSTCILLAAVMSCSNAQTGPNKPHECQRTCKKNDAKVCQYYFEVEKYYTMSKACYQCPFKVEDCFREDCIAADGVGRLITVVNRKLPADAIHVCDGDSVEIIVHNMMSEESTTLHCHGIHQNYKTPFMDGVGLLTQCPIHPMMSFKYSFTPYPSGTHMLHAHMGVQKGDGLFGGFVVRKPVEDEFYRDKYDQDLYEHLIVITDWQHEPMIDKYEAHYQALGDNKPDTLLINGRGRYKEFTNEKKEVAYTPYAKFSVQKGQRYRMRVMNIGSLYCPVQMMIDNHKMKIISTDGADIDMVEADVLNTFSGERWDFILEAFQDAGNYWIKFKGLADCDERFKKAFNLAVLHYEEAADELPKSEVTYESIIASGVEVNRVNVPSAETASITISELKSINKDPTTDPALGKLESDPTIFSYDFYEIDNPVYHKHGVYGYFDVPEPYQRRTPQFNHISLKMPSFPPLTQPEDIRSDTFCDENQDKDCKKEFCWCTYLKKFALNQVVEFIFIDEGKPYASNHPIHIHGHYCRVVAMEKIGENITTDIVLALIQENKVKLNLHDPIFKDSWTVPTKGFTVVRCYLNNAGYWLMHCHLDFHMEVGMGVIIKVGEDKTDIPPPPQNFPRCGNFGV